MVLIYVFLLLLNTAWQTVFGLISFAEAMSALVIYLLPIVFYLYFGRITSEQEIRSVLLAMIIAGIVVGFYFAYDSYNKLALGQVGDYTKKVYQYSIDRAPNQEINEMAVSVGSRSYGLLESHSVSGAWVILGCLAALALLQLHRTIIRYTVIFLSGTLLLLGLNFTTIIAFSIIMFLSEFEGFSLLRGRLSAKIGGNLVLLALIVMLMVEIAFWLAGEDMVKNIILIINYQRDYALGTGDLNTTQMGQVIKGVEGYFQHIFNFPHTLLLGDGFSVYGLKKGGDIGYFESMAKFGLPFFFLIVFGLLSLIKSGLRQIEAMRGGQATGEQKINHGRIIQFAICVTLLVLITEFHYTVWTAKSILPIVFFALALYERYLSVHYNSFTKKTNKGPSLQS
jgi:hypothetical protein